MCHAGANDRYQCKHCAQWLDPLEACTCVGWKHEHRPFERAAPTLSPCEISRAEAIRLVLSRREVVGP